MIRKRRAGLVIGTHAVIQDKVKFKNLALAIIDEQHRFGVAQRLALRSKMTEGGEEPHMLMMTATPIPRTLAMSYYADLDVSTIDELPPGRTPIVTKVVSEPARRGDRRAYAASWPMVPADLLGLPPDRGKRVHRPASTRPRPMKRTERGPARRDGGPAAFAHAVAEKAAVMALFTSGQWACWSAPRSSRSAWTCPMPR
jgi:hypothetical protein